MANENIFLLYALRMGIFITFLYDNLRAVRRVIPHNLFWISLEDLIFWIYCASQVFLLMYHESNGTLRWFAVLGALVGMMLYMRLISRHYVYCASFILGKFCFVLVKIGRVMFFPLHKMSQALKKGLKRIFRKGYKLGGRLKKKLTSYRKMLKMKT